MEYVKRWGALWATSAFIFENFNQNLAQLAPGPKHKGNQIVKKVKLAHCVEILRAQVLQRKVAPVRKNGVLGAPVVLDDSLLERLLLPSDTRVYLRACVNGIP